MPQPPESKNRVHFTLSLVKSIIRVIGFLSLLGGIPTLSYSVILLVLAEIVGILEEL